METLSTIRAFGTILLDLKTSGPLPFAENFAVKRFFKKMEKPDDSRVNELSEEAWKDFIDFDSSLPTELVLPDTLWYKARSRIHKMLEQFRLGDLVITNGSEFTPTAGRNSIEQKLARSKWETTRGNIDLFTDLVCNERSLRVSLQKRFNRHVRKKGLNPSQASRWIWRRFSHLPKHQRRREAIKAKILCVTSFVEGSRFSTARKNNEKRRPINVETLPNMLTQRCIGNGVRNLLKDFGLDLDTCADKHRWLVSLPGRSTLDLKNASDSVSIALVRFLFPRWFVDLLEQARSPTIYGLDGEFHFLKKISSMGNGFTFELMSLILYAVGLSLDDNFSVFGDDIIIADQHADRLVEALENVGFVVNKEKSFVRSKFRESCGANYHDDHGYLESYDFEYPETIMDCVTLYNKAKRLSRFPTFGELEKRLRRVVPKALRGPAELSVSVVGPSPVDLPCHFATGFNTGVRPRNFDDVSLLAKKHLSHDITESDIFVSWRFDPSKATTRKDHLKLRFHWAKYFMYLFGGRKSDDIIRGDGVWVSFLSIGSSASNTSWKNYSTSLTG